MREEAEDRRRDEKDSHEEHGSYMSGRDQS
jgi:hypothetical protein